MHARINAGNSLLPRHQLAVVTMVHLACGETLITTVKIGSHNVKICSIDENNGTQIVSL